MVEQEYNNYTFCEVQETWHDFWYTFSLPQKQPIKQLIQMKTKSQITKTKKNPTALTPKNHKDVPETIRFSLESVVAS